MRNDFFSEDFFPSGVVLSTFDARPDVGVSASLLPLESLTFPTLEVAQDSRALEKKGCLYM